MDVMVANAGVPHGAPFLELDEDTWERVLAVNLKGVFLCGQAAARAMVAGGHAGRDRQRREHVCRGDGGRAPLPTAPPRAACAC